MSNVEAKTKWMTATELKTHLRPGDLIRFKRSTYTHWAVYMGDVELGKTLAAGEEKPVARKAGEKEPREKVPVEKQPEEKEPVEKEKEEKKVVYDLIHVSGNVSGVGGFSRSLASGSRGDKWQGGAIRWGLLSTEANKDKVSRDIRCDFWFEPWDVDTILRRARREAGETPEGKPLSYSLLKINCEHFAKWCRGGVVHSKQADLGRKALKGLVLPVVGTVAAMGFNYPWDVVKKSARSYTVSPDETFEEAVKAYHKMGWMDFTDGKIAIPDK